MKKMFSLLLAVAMTLALAPVTYAAALTMVADDTWGDGAGVAGAANANDTIDLVTFTLTVESDAANDDNGGLLLFTIGAVTGTTGDVIINGENGAVTADWVANFASFALTGAGDITYQIDDADNFAITSTVAGALSTGGAVTIDNDENSTADPLAVTVTGNYTVTGATTIDAGTFNGANSTLTLNGATISSGSFVLDGNAAAQLATLTIGGTAAATSVTGTINGVEATNTVLNVTGDGTLGDTTTFNSVIGGTVAIADVNIGTGGATTAAFAGNVSATNIDIQNGSTMSLAANADWTGTAIDFETNANGDLDVATGADLNGAVTTGTASWGTVNFAGTSTVTGALGAVGGNQILAVNIGAGTVTANTGVAADTINFGAAASTTGTLSIAAGQTIEGAVTATDAGEGNVTFAGAGTLTGTIGVVGGNEIRLVTLGAGAVTASGDVAATTINYGGDGTLTMAGGTTLEGAVTTTTTNTGTLTFTAAGTQTGAVGTNSAVLKEINAGGGAVGFSSSVFATLMDLTGANTVTLSGGFGDSTFSTGIIDYEAAATLVVADNQNIFGRLTSTGDDQGILTLNGTSTISGLVGASTTLDLATINVNGAGETATFQSNVFASDLVQGAANTINIEDNTVTLGDDFSMNATGTLKLQINSASVFGNVQVTDDATIAATNLLDIVVAGGISNGATFTIVNSADAGTIAAPTTTITDNSALWSFTVAENGTADLVLTAVLNSAGVATTSTSSSALTAVNTVLAGSPSSDFVTVTGQLFSLSDTASATAALETLDPTNNGAVSQAAFNVANSTVGAITGHLGQVGGAPGVATGDFWTDNGFWIKGIGNGTDQDPRGTVSGYESTMWGTIVGMDGLIAPDMRMGLAGGYAATEVDNSGEGGGTDVDSYIGSIYFGYDDPSPWYGNFGFNFTWNTYDATRVIPFASRTATSDTDGQMYTGFVDVGYVITDEAWGMGALEVTPIASLTYSHIDIDNYTETGADSLNLAVADQDYDSVESGLGVRLAYPMTDSTGKWVPEAHYRWLYDWVDDEVQTSASFVNTSTAFTSTGLDPEESTHNVGAGLTFYTKGGVSITGVYDYEFGDDFSSHTGQGVVRWQF